MAVLTITEALAELKTTAKRIEKKHEFVRAHLMRMERLKDPLEKEGGAYASIEAARQAIHDLEERIVRIRRKISEANLQTTISVQGETRPVADWLVWRRDVAPKAQGRVNDLASGIAQVRKDMLQKGVQVVQPGETARTEDVVVNVSETKLAQEREHMELVLGELDGQLSLKNALTTFEID